MSLIPSTVASGGTLPDDLYFALKADIAPPQVLSLTGNSLALSGGGGAVNVAAATSVALSTNKLTNTTYDSLLDKTSTAGQTIVLEPALAVRIQPKLEVESELSVQSIGGKVTIINGIDGIYTTGNLQTLAEIKDSFGNPGAAGQQLQSSGPGLPWVWGAGGGGGGVTSVSAGSNISVDSTNPIAPVVNVAISSTLDMSGQEIINASDITVKGAVPGINFKNTAGVEKATLDYSQANNQVSLTAATGTVACEAAAYGSRMVIDSTGALMSSTDRDVTLQRSETGVGIKTIMTLQDSGVVQIGANGIGGNNVTLKLLNSGGKFGQLIASESGGYMAIQAESGYTMLVESTQGNVNIAAANPDTTISIDVNGGGANLTLSDSAGTNSIEMSAGGATMTVGNALAGTSIIMSTNGNANQLKQTGNHTEIVGDTTTPDIPLLQFVDSAGTVGTVSMSISNDGFGFGYPQLSATPGILSVSSGAVEGVAIGTNGTENVVIGYGLPLKISHMFDSQPRLIADGSLIKFGIGTGGGVANVEITTDGDTLVTGDNSVTIRSNLTASMEGALGSMLPSKVELISGTATTTANQINLVCGGFASGAVSMGDVFDAQNGSKIIINDASSFISITTGNLTLPTIPLATKSNILYYDSLTKAVSYGANVLPVFVVGATSATAITLTAADNNKTYVFTTRPSAFQQFNAVGLPLGFSISVRNAAGTGGGDIDIRKDGGVSLGTLHPRTGAVNASTVPLEVNGTGLIGYF